MGHPLASATTSFARNVKLRQLAGKSTSALLCLSFRLHSNKAISVGRTAVSSNALSTQSSVLRTYRKAAVEFSRQHKKSKVDAYTSGERKRVVRACTHATISEQTRKNEGDREQRRAQKRAQRNCRERAIDQVIIWNLLNIKRKTKPQ